jgi:hypothetical protein
MTSKEILISDRRAAFTAESPRTLRKTPRRPAGTINLSALSRRSLRLGGKAEYGIPESGE